MGSSASPPSTRVVVVPLVAPEVMVVTVTFVGDGARTRGDRAVVVIAGARREEERHVATSASFPHTTTLTRLGGRAMTFGLPAVQVAGDAPGCQGEALSLVGADAGIDLEAVADLAVDLHRPWSPGPGRPERGRPRASSAWMFTGMAALPQLGGDVGRHRCQQKQQRVDGEGRWSALPCRAGSRTP